MTMLSIVETMDLPDHQFYCKYLYYNYFYKIPPSLKLRKVSLLKKSMTYGKLLAQWSGCGLKKFFPLQIPLQILLRDKSKTCQVLLIEPGECFDLSAYTNEK
jgi:hypothetical protein